MTKNLPKQLASILYIACLASGSIIAMATKKTTAVHIPAPMQKYFHQTPDWDGYDNKASGWLKIPGQGSVYIKLLGKNYYDPNNKPKDYKISYVGFDDNGFKHQALPKGLYYWQEPGSNPDLVIGAVKPAADNKHAGKSFFYETGTTWTEPFGNPPITWDVSKIADPHPTKEIAELFYTLEHT